jgi:hypothetical protein
VLCFADRLPITLLMGRIFGHRERLGFTARLVVPVLLALGLVSYARIEDGNMLEFLGRPTREVRFDTMPLTVAG